MKIFCVGRNYIDHAKELSNPVPEKPVIFLKPQTAQLKSPDPFYYPNFSKEIHYEAELVVKMDKNGKAVRQKHASSYYSEITVGIDFTARDIQNECKEKRLPWEIAKAFDKSAAVGDFLQIDELGKWEDLNFRLRKNGKIVQDGHPTDMIFNIDYLISYISQYFTINRGDLIFTGTPAGVGPVRIGEHLKADINGKTVLDCAIR